MPILHYLPHYVCSKLHCWHLAPEKNKIQTQVCVQYSVCYHQGTTTITSELPMPLLVAIVMQ